MTGRMIDFDANGKPAPGYLAAPEAGAEAAAAAPGVVVLHAWWGLTEPFRQVCDRLADAGFVALAPDLYRGKTTAKVEEADAWGSALDQQEEQWRGDIAGAMRFLRHYGQPSAPAASNPAGGTRKLALIGFSLGGAYALDTSVERADEVAAVVIFYDAYPGLDYRRARTPYLFHYAEDDTFVPAAKTAEMEQELRAADKQSAFYIYPGTRHWFFEANRPDAYDVASAALAWERTLAFLNAELRRT